MSVQNFEIIKMFHEVQHLGEFTGLDPKPCRYPNSKTWGGFSSEESLCLCSGALICDNPRLHPVQTGRQTGGRQKKRLRQRWFQAEERVCEVCVQRTLRPWARSRPGRATSVTWWCRGWETGRSPPPSWNLSYPVCWPEQEWPPSVGPRHESEKTSMRLSAQFMHNTHQRKSPKLRLRHRSLFIDVLTESEVKLPGSVTGAHHMMFPRHCGKSPPDLCVNLTIFGHVNIK